MSAGPVALRPIADANRQAVEALRVSPAQERFVSDVAESLREAAEHPGAHAIYWALCDGDTPVGFVMIADEVDRDEYMPQFLWKLLIDERHQGRGYGTAALDLVVEWFRGPAGRRGRVDERRQGEGSPIPFYERYGFVRTGEMFDGEVLLKLVMA